MSRPAPDLEIRLKALDPRGSFILEAPAGSGKTDLLTARFLALLGTVASPGQIVALTFTRKAADQMQQRILGVLERARRGAEPEHEWDAHLLDLARRALDNPGFAEGVLRNPQSYRVGTFHSFCSSVAGGWPLEAGVPPGAALLDELDQGRALEAAVESCFEAILLGGAPELREAFERRLAAADNGYERLREQVISLMAHRDRLLAFEEFLRSGGGDLGLAAGRILSGLVAVTIRPARAHFLKHEEQWRELRRALEECGSPCAVDCPLEVPGEGLEAIPAWQALSGLVLKSDGGTYTSFSGAKFGAGFGKTAAAQFLKELPAEAAEALAAVRRWPSAGEDPVGLVALADLLTLAGAARRHLAARIPGAGLDYLELELAALRSLRWAEVPSESLIFYNEHLRHLLVDEAQDMNEVQVQILSRLTEGWEPGDGRSLFVVGDPKQSIFRFRRAEVSLFTGLQERGLEREGEAAYPLVPLELTANFRSEPALVRFCNALFETLWAESGKDGEGVAFRASEPAREASYAGVGVYVALFTQGEEAQPGAAPLPSAAEREAAYVAGRVAELHAAEPQATIALLFPARPALGPFVSALNRLGVPVRLVEGESLVGRPEVRHLVNLFTALARPYDDVAWAGCLRSPWFWVSDAELLRLSSLEGFWSSKVLAQAEGETPSAPFALAAREALAAFGREPFEKTLSRLWEELGGPAAAAARYGAAGVANARAFLDLLAACSGRPAEEALSRLTELLDSAYTPQDPRAAFSPVFAMTIHKAKGLEFDHVFAVALGRDPLGGSRQEHPSFRMERVPLPGKPVLVAAGPDAGRGEPNLAYRLLEELDQRRQLDESLRLFYVAATRARRSLTLTGRAAYTQKGILSVRKRYSALGRLLASVGGVEGASGEPWSSLGLRLEIDPQPPCAEAPEGRPRLPGEPPPFEAQPLPYRISSPSALQEETAQAAPFGADDAADASARPRGVVLHRLWECLALGASLPSERAVAAALAAEGMGLAQASEQARGVLEEAMAAWEYAPFADLRKGAVALRPEVGIEDHDGAGGLRVGRLDLLIERPNGLIIVDYKTGRADEGEEGWVAAQREHYGPQLRAYVQMASRAFGAEPANVRAFIYLTALRRLVEL